MKFNPTLGLALCLAGILALPGPVNAAPLMDLDSGESDWECGSFFSRDRVAPMDYRKQPPILKTVEEYHYGKNVENLSKSMYVGVTLGSDHDYTLWAFPNHHRALASVVRLAEREKTDQPSGCKVSVDCYFRRAIRFAPTDLIVRLLYADYLRRKQRNTDAVIQLEDVVENADENPMTLYNAGMIYFDLGRLEKSAALAARAADLGYAPPLLARLLTEKGVSIPAAGASSKPAASAAEQSK